MSLKVFARDGALKSSTATEVSSTAKMLELIAEKFLRVDVRTETIRLADHDVKL
jgi:hypothetical protein